MWQSWQVVPMCAAGLFLKEENSSSRRKPLPRVTSWQEPQKPGVRKAKKRLTSGWIFRPGWFGSAVTE